MENESRYALRIAATSAFTAQIIDGHKLQLVTSSIHKIFPLALKTAELTALCYLMLASFPCAVHTYAFYHFETI
jgi:TctA family transporter